MSNASELARLAALPGQVRSRLRSVIKGLAKTQVVDMQRRFNGRPGLISRSGFLKSSFKSEVDDTAAEGPSAVAYTDGSAARTSTGASYAHVQEHGATIVPKRKESLIFFVDGHWVTTKRVVVPPRLKFFESFKNRAPGRERQIDREIEGVIKAN